MLMVLTGVEAQSYVMVSGTSLPVSSPSNLMIDYSLSTYDQSLEPGDSGTLTLVIKNTGSQSAETRTPGGQPAGQKPRDVSGRDRDAQAV